MGKYSLKESTFYGGGPFDMTGDLWDPHLAAMDAALAGGFAVSDTFAIMQTDTRRCPTPHL